jgi:hypothetical protein
MDTSKRILPKNEKLFTNLFSSGYEKTSEEDESYNCIAWAAGEKNTEDFWTPCIIGHGYYWPDELPKKTDLETFIQLYRLKGGYEPLEKISFELEDGIEKIALYLDDQNEVSHAARQKEDGTWASKLGELEDIEHLTPEALCTKGKELAYGSVAKILARRRKKP